MNSAGGDGAGGVSGMGGSGGASGSSGAGADSGGSAGAGGSASAESVCPPGPYAANPLPADLTLTTLCPGNHTSEGIVWFADLGVAFFSNFDSGDVAGNFNGNIVRYTPGTGCETFVMTLPHTRAAASISPIPPLKRAAAPRSCPQQCTASIRKVS